MSMCIMKAVQYLVCVYRCVFCVVDTSIFSLRASQNVRTVITQNLVTTCKLNLKVHRLFVQKLKQLGLYDGVLGDFQLHQIRCVFP